MPVDVRLAVARLFTFGPFITKTRGLILHPLASRECCRRTCIGEGLGTHPIVVQLVNRNRIRVTEVVQVNPGGFPSAPDRDGRDDGHSEGDRPIVSGMLVEPGGATVAN